METKIKRKGFQFRFSPNGEQQRQFARIAGACRFVYNMALAERIRVYKEEEKSTSFFTTSYWLTEWKKEISWLVGYPRPVIAESLRDLDKAYKNFFKLKMGFPKFKKKSNTFQIRFPLSCHFKIEQGNKRIKLPLWSGLRCASKNKQSGWMRYRKSQEIIGKAKNITVIKKSKHWYISVQTEIEYTPPESLPSQVGIDRGISRFATLSNGEFYKPLNSFRVKQKEMAKLQRAMSRKKKFSNNWKKAKAKITRLHESIANHRKDFNHKISTDITTKYGLVAMEDLKVVNMSSSAKGTVEKPGRNVKAKSGLNKAILDQGWGEFKRQLEYKTEWNGGIFMTVPPQYTSQTCPSCNHVSKDNRKTQSNFTCVECDYKENADVVGAINILRLAVSGEKSPDKGLGKPG